VMFGLRYSWLNPCVWSVNLLWTVRLRLPSNSTLLAKTTFEMHTDSLQEPITPGSVGGVIAPSIVFWNIQKSLRPVLAGD
jgi:hypothetical protein